MKVTFVIMAILYSIIGSAQINWTKCQDWMLYKANDSVMFRVKPDSLTILPNYSLDKDTMSYYLQDAKPLSAGTKGAWMGGFLASCTIDGQIKKIFISSYGAFIYEPQSGLFYQLPLDQKDNWFSYINRCASKLQLYKIPNP